MAAGRRPNITALHVVDKAHANRHYNQPEPSKDWPVAPEYLSEPAKVIFNNLVDTIAELYPPSASHVEMLALYAQHKELEVYLDSFLREDELIEIKNPITGEYEFKTVQRGLTYRTKNALGELMIKPRPEVKMLQDARKACSDILKEFGLSPSSQRSVKIEKKKVQENAFAKLHGKAGNE